MFNLFSRKNSSSEEDFKTAIYDKDQLRTKQNKSVNRNRIYWFTGILLFLLIGAFILISSESDKGILGGDWFDTANNRAEDTSNDQDDNLPPTPVPDTVTIETVDTLTVYVPTPAPVPVDSDDDGVPDSRDNCLNTPRGVEVDRNGCQLRPEVFEENYFFADFDGDGLGDPNQREKSSAAPPRFVGNSDDECPSRKGSLGGSGCPELAIQHQTGEVYMREGVQFDLVYDGAKSNDICSWNSNLSADIQNQSKANPRITFQKVGKASISVTVNNSQDQFSASSELENIQVKVRENYLENLFAAVLKIGHYDGMPVPDYDRDAARASSKEITSYSTGDCVVVSDRNVTFSGNGKLSSFLRLAKQPGMPASMLLEPFTIHDIKYDATTGKIKKIMLKVHT